MTNRFPEIPEHIAKHIFEIGDPPISFAFGDPPKKFSILISPPEDVIAPPKGVTTSVSKLSRFFEGGKNKGRAILGKLAEDRTEAETDALISAIGKFKADEIARRPAEWWWD